MRQRSSSLGQAYDVSEMFSKEQSLEMFEKLCRIRYFELNVKEAYDQKKIKAPIYLSIGQEAVPAALSTVYKPDSKFTQHRGHGYYIAYGGDLEALADELLHKPTGCAKGMAGSASIHSPKIGMIGHDGHMGSEVPIGVGYLFGRNFKTGLNEKGLIVVGDAAAEEDYVLATYGYASKKNIQCLFVCEDNNLSILTKVEARRNWKTSNVARSFGLESIDITDDPWIIMYYAKEFDKKLPAFMNIHVARAVWHAGTGNDGPPEWDRFSLIREELERLELKKESDEIEAREKNEISELWKRL